MLKCISTAQARTKCMSAFWPHRSSSSTSASSFSSPLTPTSTDSAVHSGCSSKECIYLPIYLSFFLSIHLSIYPFVCLSVCQPVAAAWRHSSMMSAVPVVVGLGVCLMFLPVAWPCGCLVVSLQPCSAVLRCLDLMLMSTCGVSAPSAVNGMSLSLPCCLRAA